MTATRKTFRGAFLLRRESLTLADLYFRTGSPRTYFSALKPAPYLFRRERQIVQTKSRRAIDAHCRSPPRPAITRLARPLEPNGPGPFSLSTKIVSKSFGKSLETRHPIVDQIGVEQLAVLVNHFFHQAVADGVHDAALVLPFAEHRVNRLADVGEGNIFEQFDFAGVADRPLLPRRPS